MKTIILYIAGVENVRSLKLLVKHTRVIWFKDSIYDFGLAEAKERKKKNHVSDFDHHMEKNENGTDCSENVKGT